MIPRTSVFFPVILCLLWIDSSHQKNIFTDKNIQLVLETAYDIFLKYRKVFVLANPNYTATKSQPVIPASTPFPCDLTSGRSKVRPSSVHRLRPGDIDVIGALGDSLTSGFGAHATGVLSTLVADRGLAFPIGGAGTWRTAFTLPNVLKLYNPNLFGYSRGTGLSWNLPSQFNVAEGIAISSDLLHQARELVRRMRADFHVDFENDWKMVTIMMGNNDHCSIMCFSNLNQVLNDHRRDMIAALDYLRDTVPRLFVNVLAPPDAVRLLFDRFDSIPPICTFINKIECACLVDQQFQVKRPVFGSLIQEWQRIDEEITLRPEYMNKEDFAVVFQPFTLGTRFPHAKIDAEGKSTQDPTIFAPDCFHFSQKTHALVANNLWNNIMQPVGSKSRDWVEKFLEEVTCPNETHPYFYTAKNSVAGFT